MAKKSNDTAVPIRPAEEWAVEQDMRALMEAKEIQADPKRMAKVKAMARKKLESVAGVFAETAES